MPRVDKSVRERAVIDTALRLLAQEGGDALTVRRVATEAKIPMSSLYQMFPSLSAVRAALLREVAERITQRIEALPVELSGRQWAWQR